MPPRAPKRHPLNQSRLYRVDSRGKLAGLFGLTRKSLDAVLAMERPYTNRQMEQHRNGKTKSRTIQEPRGDLRPIHSYVSKALSRIEPPEFLYCPVKLRSYVSNARRHADSKEVRKLDVREYFPSTPSYRVYWFFHTVMRCSTDVAAVLAKLLTVEGHLATGSTVSPILSFYAFNDMWRAIAKLAEDAGCILTVYMDDAALSGDAVPDSLVWEVRKAIYSRGLRYHKECRYAHGIAEVTGAIIRGGKLMVPNRQLKKAYEVREALKIAVDPAEVAALKSRLRGLNDQRRQVEGR
jgi:hypothetical protein